MNVQRVLNQIELYAEITAGETNIPGLSIAVTDRKETNHSLGYSEFVDRVYDFVYVFVGKSCLLSQPTEGGGPYGNSPGQHVLSKLFSTNEFLSLGAGHRATGAVKRGPECRGHGLLGSMEQIRSRFH